MQAASILTQLFAEMEQRRSDQMNQLFSKYWLEYGFAISNRKGFVLQKIEIGIYGYTLYYTFYLIYTEPYQMKPLFIIYKKIATNTFGSSIYFFYAVCHKQNDFTK